MEPICNGMRLVLVCLSFLLLTGCWDHKDIEEYYLQVGDALDLAEESMAGESEEPNRNFIALTVQYVIPKAAAGQDTQTTQQKPYQNVSSTGDTVLQTWHSLFLKVDRPFFLNHLKVIVIGEELARRVNMHNLFIDYLRAQEVRGSVVILVAKGRASETLETRQPTDIPAFRLIGLTENQQNSAQILPVMTLMDVSAKMASDSSFLLQSVVSEKGEAKFVGAAVIKGKINKLIGFLNVKELEGLNWVMGEVKGGSLKAYDEKTKRPVVFDIESTQSNIKPRVQGNKISFDIEIEAEGVLQEDWIFPGNAFENKYIKEMEKAFQKKVIQMAETSLNKIQKEYKADVAGFGNQLRIHYPEVWQKVKKDWDHQFSQAPVKVGVKINIRGYETKGTKKK